MSGQAPLAPLAAPRSLAEDAADRIRAQILSGGFSQGEHLVEAKIAEQLAISRGPVREAFKLLRAEGLLKEEPRQGHVRREPHRRRRARDLRATVPRSREVPRACLRADVTPRRWLAFASLVDEIDAAVAARRCGGGLSGRSRVPSRPLRAVRQLPASSRSSTGTCPRCARSCASTSSCLRSLSDVSVQHRPFLEAIEAGDEDKAARFARRAFRGGGRADRPGRGGQRAVGHPSC